MTRENPLTESRTKTRLSPYSKDQWRIVECQETGMVYLENPPKYEEMVDDFAWEKTFAEERKRRREEQPIVSRLSDVSKKSRKYMQKLRKIEKLPVAYFKSLPRERRPQPRLVMLDVGCGVAENTVVIANQLQDHLGLPVVPIGVEISREQAKIAGGRLSQFEGGYCLSDSAIGGLGQIDDTSADLIVLCSFLEHEAQPLPLLRMCARKLKPDGVVIIKVPNYDCWNRRIRQGRWCGFRYPDHVNYFTPKTLSEMIERAGLKVARMRLADRFPLNDNMYAVASPQDGVDAK